MIDLGRRLGWFIATIFLTTFVLSQFANAITEQELNKLTFAGWDGIRFSCSPTTGVAWTQDLCRMASEDARFLAKLAKIPIYVCDADCDAMDWENYKNQMKYELTLTVTVLSTKGLPAGGTVSVQATNYYTRAVEHNKPRETEDPATVPKPGELELWARRFSFISPNPNLSSFNSEIEIFLKELFSSYLDAHDGSN